MRGMVAAIAQPLIFNCVSHAQGVDPFRKAKTLIQDQSFDTPIDEKKPLAIKVCTSGNATTDMKAWLPGYTAFVVECVMDMLKQGAGQVHGRVLHGGDPGQPMYIEINPHISIL
jgi:hypothetical protein